MEALRLFAAEDFAASAPALTLHDLHLTPETLARLLVERLEAGDAVNAFLLAAGLQQVAEDVLEADVLHLSDVERVLTGPAPAIGAAAAALAGARRGTRRPLRRLAAWERRLHPLVERLADAVAAGAVDVDALTPEAVVLQATLPASPAFRAAVIRLPSCFRGFDQHPEDLRRLAARVAAAQPDRECPIVAVGLRTSGSYMAPLLAAMLRADGYAGASALSVRPARPLPLHKRRALRAARLVVITDDPPASGDSIATVARAVERMGMPREAILLALALFGDELPDALTRWPAAILRWEEWSVHERLEPGAIADALARLWPMRHVTAVRRVPMPASRLRGNVSARYRVELAGAAPEDVYVRGTGYGYFGEHAVAVDRQLDLWTADLHGVVDGLAFRRWIGEERRARELDAEGVASYVAERRRTLAVDEDPTPRFAGQDPVWEVAGNLLSAAFGRGWRVARVAGLDAALRRLLRAERPSVVDGSMSARHWFASEGGGLRKAAPDQRAFSNRNLGCYDAAFDLAAAAAGDHDGGERLHAAWHAATGETVSPERWLAYELVALWAERRDGAGAAETERASARALQRYFARVYLNDHPTTGSGLALTHRVTQLTCESGLNRDGGVAMQDLTPFVALDVDGVLETDALGYPSLSPASALALRALLAHGYRPVLATGRSLGEVRERCRAYGLAGGVAEYGSVLYDAATDEARSLVDDAGAAALARLRAALAALPDVHVGDDHRYAVRAWRVGSDGRTRSLQVEQIDAALDAAGREHVRVVPGEGQNDFVAATVGKAQALRALLGDEPLALAVGDAVEDIPMLALAQLGLAPANADAAMRASGHRRTRRPYQAGLAEAVGELVGHQPGACPHCAAPADAPGRDVILGVLGARERGPAHMAWRTARLLSRARRA